VKHYLKSEMKRSMDALCFSEEDKNAMVQNLMAQSGWEEKAKFSVKKLTLITLAAVTALITLTGAAVVTRWSTAAQDRYAPSPQIKEQAEKSGLAVMLEETKGAKSQNEVLSVTDQGITITAVQTIVDQYSAELFFRVEGFDMPEGRFPAAWPMVTIDGGESFGSKRGWFSEGLTQNEQGELVYTDGTPVQSDADGGLILRYAAEDGSLEFIENITFKETDGRYLGKEIEITFPFIGIQSVEKAGPMEPVVEGDWTLKWTLTGTDSSITFIPNVTIGDSDVTLLEAEVGQRTIRTRYRLREYWEGYAQMEEFPQAFRGVRMKDGSEQMCTPLNLGFENLETDFIYFMDCTVDFGFIDPSQVESLMFHKDWKTDANGEPTSETFYYIPVSTNE